MPLLDEADAAHPVRDLLQQLKPMDAWEWTKSMRSAADGLVRRLELDLQLLHDADDLINDFDRLGSPLITIDDLPRPPLRSLSVSDAVSRVAGISRAANDLIGKNKPLVKAIDQMDEINTKLGKAEAHVDDLIRRREECTRALLQLAGPQPVEPAESASEPQVMSRHPQRRRVQEMSLNGTSPARPRAGAAEVARHIAAARSAEVKRLRKEIAHLEVRLTESQSAMRILDEERLALEISTPKLRNSVDVESVTGAMHALHTSARVTQLLQTLPIDAPETLGTTIQIKIASAERMVSDLGESVPSEETQRQLHEIAVVAAALKQARRAQAEAARSQRMRDAERAVEAATQKRAAKRAKSTERQGAKQAKSLERETARQIASLERHLASLEQRAADLAADVRLGRQRRRAMEEALETATEALARTVAQRVLKDHSPLPNWPRMTHYQREAAILANPVHFPAIDNLLAKQRRLQQKIADAEFREYQLRAVERNLETACAQLSSLRSGAGSGRTGRRPKQVVLDWQAAERLARDYMKWLGFSDCQLTGDGADGGIDVMSAEGVGQVKMHNKGTGRPDVQQLFGIAAAEQRIPLMFAMSYTADAIAWAEKHRVAIFRFARSGDVEAASREGQRLVDEGLPKGRSGASPKKKAAGKPGAAGKPATKSSAGSGRAKRAVAPSRGRERS